MTATLDAVANGKKDKPEPTAGQKLAEELVARAREQGVSLTGPEGLLKQLTKTVLETALNQEMTEHLGHGKHGRAGNETGNVRNRTRPTTVLTEASGQVPLEVPRDRAGTFEPRIVNKRQRRRTGVGEIVLSRYARGLTTGEISAHFAEIYGAWVSKETISPITGKVIEEMAAWQARPLEVYAAIFIDAIVVKVRDGQVANRPQRRGHRRHPRRGQRHPRPVGRHRRGGREVLDERAHRPAQPRRHGRVLRGLRRAHGPARGGGAGRAGRDRAGLYRPLPRHRGYADIGPGSAGGRG